MKKLLSFEELIGLNEAFEPKDETRISDIVRKAAGDKDIEIRLATTMAKIIKDADKAFRRGEAAEAQGLDYLAQIFFDRASELSGSPKSSRPASEPASAPEAESEPEETPVEKPRVVRTPRPAVSTRPKVGDFFKVSAETVLAGRVELTDKKHWRAITPSNKGNRQWEVNQFVPGRHVKYGRGRHANRHWQPEVSATAYIDKAYLESLRDEAIFYVKATKVSSTWIEGKVHYPNGLEPTDYLVRFKTSEIRKNGPELQIFLDNEASLSTLRFSTRFFSGDEDFLLNEDGSPFTEEFLPGSYVALSLHHRLSAMKGEPVFYVSPFADKAMKRENFFVALSDWEKMEESITKEKAQVVADFLSSEIGAEVTVKSWSSNGDTVFSIPWFSVKGEKTGKYLDGYSAKPFFTREKATEHILTLKERAKNERLPYSVENLRTVEGTGSSNSWDNAPYSINFSNLMDYAKLVGIEVKLRKFFEEKRGAVRGKSFGF